MQTPLFRCVAVTAIVKSVSKPQATTTRNVVN